MNFAIVDFHAVQIEGKETLQNLVPRFIFAILRRIRAGDKIDMRRLHHHLADDRAVEELPPINGKIHLRAENSGAVTSPAFRRILIC